MIQITPHIRIFLCKEPVDFRKGIDGLACICRNILSKDPFSGSMFIFRNKKRTTLKILLYDGQGFWLFIKRLSTGRFSWWPTNQNSGNGGNGGNGGTCTLTLPLSAPELHLLIWNGDPSTASIGPDWKKIAA